MKPPIPYFGGKTSTAERIAALLPAHQHYVEPYCGSLSVLLAKPPAKIETVNDLDRELMTFWQVLRDRPDDLARGRGRTLREDKTGWKHYVYPSGTSIGMPGYLDGYVGRMAAAAARLHTVSLESMPALDLIAKYGAEPDVLLYVDPPYLGTTRDHRNNYKHEMKAEADHRDLAAALRAARAAVVVSGYASDLYDRELFAGWDRVTLAAFTGNGGEGGTARTEILWSNRPLGTELSLFDLPVGARER